MRRENIRINDLFLGKTDAKNELLNCSDEEVRFFMSSFLMPDNVSLRDFTDRNVYYVVGMKGTGKTALLRYLELEIRKDNPNCVTDFILFKSKISDEERNKFTIASNGFVVDRENVDFKEFTRYTGVWEWFIYRQILRLSKESPYALFENDEAWKDFEECMMRPLESKSERWYSNLGIKVKHGNVSVSAASKHLSASLGLDFDMEKKDKTVNFAELVSQARTLFSRLTPTGYPLYLFVDELEVTLSEKKQYTRDVQMVRDMILTIESFNRECLRLRYPIRLIAGVRTEVLSAVEVTGQELNKIIADFGRPLHWQHAGSDYKNHPLMQLLVKRIQASELILGLEPPDADSVWKQYFPAFINNDVVQKYILELTWDRPRDIIRLLDISKKQFGKERMFSQKVFEGIAKEYAKESWIELTEELNAIYTHSEISGIKEMLTGIECPFTYAQIKQSAEVKREFSEDLDNLLNKHRLPEILRNLYNVGIIGNFGKRVRFSFRGDDGLLLDHEMKIVDPLWKYFSISRRPNPDN